MGTYFDEIILGQKVTLTGEGAVLKGNIKLAFLRGGKLQFARGLGIRDHDRRSRGGPGIPLRPGMLRINLFPATEPESPKPCGV